MRNPKNVNCNNLCFVVFQPRNTKQIRKLFEVEEVRLINCQNSRVEGILNDLIANNQTEDNPVYRIEYGLSKTFHTECEKSLYLI